MNGYRVSFEWYSLKTNVEHEFLLDGNCLVSKSVFWIGVL